MRTKGDIIASHYTCRCSKIYTSRNMVDPSCVLHEEGGEIELIMDEYAKECFIEIGKWIKDNEFIEQDGMWYEQPMYFYEKLGICIGDYSDLFNKFQQEKRSLK